MKKVLLFSLLLLCFFAQSQNIELLQKANKCDLSSTQSIANEIISLSKNKYVYYTTKESSYLHLITLVYIPVDYTAENKKGLDAYLSQYIGRNELEIKDCLCIHFRVDEVGANPDLEVKGTKQYSFDFVNGKYLDLFPFYQKEIEPTATTDNTTTSGIYSVRKDAEGYWYNFLRTSNGLWHLKNMSSRLK